MWPWEHLAFGYVLYSGYTRFRFGPPPEDYPVLTLAVTTQLPDLIDKPLAWSFRILPSGLSLGHSIFFAVAVVTTVAILARRGGVPAVGDAVAIGYLSHLAGDILYPVLRGGDASFSFLLWPLVSRPDRDSAGLFERTARLFEEFVQYLGSPDGLEYLAFELGLILFVFLLWAADGWPGLWIDYWVGRWADR